MKLVEVVWVDAGLKTGWQSYEEITAWMTNDAHFECITLGYVFMDNDEYMVIVQGATDGSLLNPIRINKNNIILVKELKDAEPETDAGDERPQGAGEESRYINTDGASA